MRGPDGLFIQCMHLPDGGSDAGGRHSHWMSSIWGTQGSLGEVLTGSQGNISLAYYGVRHSRRALNKKVTPATRIDPLAFETTCLETSKHLQVTQQAVSLIEKRVFKKLRHCLAQCEREGLFDREDPEAGRIFLRVFSDALRDVKASKNAILIRPI